MDYSLFIGEWKNTFDDTKGIKDFDLIEKGEDLVMGLRGMENGLLSSDWGAVQVEGHTKTPDSIEVIALQALFEKEDREISLAININKGLIIIAAYCRFKEKELGRSNFFIREFFSKK